MYTPLWQRLLKNYALWKFFSKCVKFGTKSTHFNMGHINALWKKIENHILHDWLYFSCLKISNIIINLENASISSNVLLTILSIVRLIVMGLKNYCWDKSGFASCKFNQFLQTRFCHIFSSQTYYYFYLFQIVELLEYIEPTGASGLYIHPAPENFIDPFLGKICYILRNG